MSEYHEDISRAAVKAVLDAPIEVPRTTAVIATIAKALAENDQRCRWLPIVSAPMDGTSIMTYPHYLVTHWEGGDEVVSSEACFVERYDADWEGWLRADPQPTHWMPLPSPPSKVEAM